jgi:formylglycine-generating enzyme required for sulfatase activity
VPAVDTFKWVERRHSTTSLIQWWETDRTCDIQSAFFNGDGFNTQENVWGEWHPLTERSGEAARRAFAILRFLSAAGGFLVSEEWEPHCALAAEAAAAGVFASRWPAPAGAAFATGNATAWTLVGTGSSNFSGATVLVPCPPPSPDVLYFDLYAGAQVAPVPYSGGGPGCAVSAAVEASGYAAVLAAPAAGAQGNATLAAFLQTMANMTAVRALESFDPTQPPFPNQTMTARAATARAPSPPPGMVHVPAAAAFNFTVTAAPYSGQDVQFPFEPGVSSVHSAVIAVPAFFIDASPVTNAAFAAFLQGASYAPQDTHNFLRDWGAAPGAHTPPAGWDAKPVTWVDLVDAEAYCAWAGKRLPQDYEWQRAMQGDDGRAYPWGPAFNQSCVPPQQQGAVRGAPPDVGNGVAGCASPFGAQDAIGTVWQWTSEFADERTRVGLIRGGSYYAPQGSQWYPQNDARDPTHTSLLSHNQLRLMDASYDRHGTVGFRCVVDAQ